VLTDEQERQRAIEVSKLYGVPIQHHKEVQPYVPLTFGLVFQVALLFVLPLVLINAVLSLYLYAPMSNLADIQAASIGLVVALLLLCLLFFVTLRSFRLKLYYRYRASRPVFWLSVLLLLPVLVVIRGLTAGLPPQPIDEIMLRSMIFTGIAYATAVIFFAVIGSLFEAVVRRNKRS